MGEADRIRASELTSLVDPWRLRVARESQGWTQAELVRQMAEPISTAALSQLETGRAQPSAQTLAGIADAVGYPVEFFARRSGDNHPEGFFRSLRSAPARERRAALAQAHLLHDFVVAAERHVRLPDLDLPPRPADIDDDIIDWTARQVRNNWDLGNEPIDNMVRTLERHGVVVARHNIDTDHVDAFSVHFPDRPIVVLAANKDTTARSRFDAAHELGHLILHDDTDAGEKEAERQAHRFAAALLMPEATIRDELPSSANWRDLLTLKRRWRTSIQALLMRSKDLGVMSGHTYTNAMKQMSARGWRKQEPGDAELGPPEEPLLLEALATGLRRAGTSVDEVATEAGLPVAPLRRMLNDSTDTRPQVEL
jgi:Zn-dependent peptidase ImmA (M78 family)/DNA-binding XRE family transcriptional regulator